MPLSKRILQRPPRYCQLKNKEGFAVRKAFDTLAAKASNGRPVSQAYAEPV